MPTIPRKIRQYKLAPLRTAMYDAQGNMTMPWVLYFQNLAATPVIGFIVNDGSTGTNIGPELQAARTGQVDVVTVAIKASDASTALTFLIKQNGVNIFRVNPTVAANAPATTSAVNLLVFVLPALLLVTEDDVFTIDISSGSSSWQFTAAVENSQQ